MAANPSNHQYIFIDDAAQTSGRFRQYFQDTVAFTADYTNWLADNETLAGAIYTVTPATSPALGIAGSVVRPYAVDFFTVGGVPGTTYKVQISTTTTSGQTKTNTIIVVVDTFVSGADCAGVSPTDSGILAQLLAAATSASNAAATAQMFSTSTSGFEALLNAWMGTLQTSPLSPTVLQPGRWWNNSGLPNAITPIPIVVVSSAPIIVTTPAAFELLMTSWAYSLPEDPLSPTVLPSGKWWLNSGVPNKVP